MTSGSCSCHEHTTNLATGVSRQPVLDCGTIFHPDCGGRTFLRFLQTIFENTSLWRLKRLSTYRRYINKCIYLSIYMQYQRIFFGLCDLSFEPMTLIYEFDLKTLKTYSHTKNDLQRLSALQTDRRTDIHTYNQSIIRPKNHYAPFAGTNKRKVAQLSQRPRCRVGQCWPKVEDDILQTI